MEGNKFENEKIIENQDIFKNEKILEWVANGNIVNDHILNSFNLEIPPIIVSNEVLKDNISRLNIIENIYKSNPCRCLQRQNACGTCMGCKELITNNCLNTGCPKFVCQRIKECNKCGKNIKVF